MQAIEYDLTEDDFVEFGLASLQASPGYLRLLRWLIIIGCALVLIAFGILIRTGGAQWPAWLVLGLGLPFAILGVPIIIWGRMPGVIRKSLREGSNRHLLGKQKLEISPEGVRRTHAGKESMQAWTSVQRLLLTRRNVALLVAGNQAFVVPRGAFSKPADEASFIANVEKLSKRRFAKSRDA